MVPSNENISDEDDKIAMASNDNISSDEDEVELSDRDYEAHEAVEDNLSQQLANLIKKSQENRIHVDDSMIYLHDVLECRRAFIILSKI